MKKNILLLLSLLLVGLPAMAQTAEQKAQDEIVKALKAGDSKALSDYFSDNLEIDLQNKQQVYSKAQATEILKDFFAKNKPTGFNTLHQGGKDQVKYLIGTLTINGGKTYRVSVFIKSDKCLIQQLRIE